jgi:hypothetical protein
MLTAWNIGAQWQSGTEPTTPRLAVMRLSGAGEVILPALFTTQINFESYAACVRGIAIGRHPGKSWELRSDVILTSH